MTRFDDDLGEYSPPEAKAEAEASGLFDHLGIALFVAPGVALIGGLLSAPVALIVNTMETSDLGGLGFLGAILVAPWVEELVKPLGVYLLIWKLPKLFTSRLYNALLAGMGGLVFATLENLFYIHISFPDMDAATAQFRWVYCTALHVTCSTIFGLGMTPSSFRAMWHGGKGMKWHHYTPALVSMGLHAAWNLVATIGGIVESF